LFFYKKQCLRPVTKWLVPLAAGTPAAMQGKKPGKGKWPSRPAAPAAYGRQPKGSFWLENGLENGWGVLFLLPVIALPDHFIKKSVRNRASLKFVPKGQLVQTFFSSGSKN
jgi:hypothetical protein